MKRLTAIAVEYAPPIASRELFSLMTGRFENLALTALAGFCPELSLRCEEASTNEHRNTCLKGASVIFVSCSFRSFVLLLTTIRKQMLKAEQHRQIDGRPIWIARLSAVLAEEH